MLQNLWNFGRILGNRFERVRRSQKGFLPPSVNIAFFRPSKSDSASRATNATGHKARPAGDIKEGEMRHDSSRSVRIFRLSHPNNYATITMPAQSRLLPIEGYSGYDLVPFRSEYHPDTIRYILENSLLTMGLCDCHLH